MDEAKFVTVEYFPWLEEVRAQIARSMLESFGIDAQLLRTTLTNTLTFWETGQIYIELVVNEKDAARAREILSAQFDRQEAEQGYKEQDEKK